MAIDRDSGKSYEDETSTDDSGRLLESVNSDHRETLRRIFDHPASGNIEWRQVRSLLDAVGTTREQNNGKLKVTVDGQSLVLQPPHGKDVDREMIGDLRRLLNRWEARLVDP